MDQLLGFHYYCKPYLLKLDRLMRASSPTRSCIRLVVNSCSPSSLKCLLKVIFNKNFDMNQLNNQPMKDKKLKINYNYYNIYFL